MGRGPLWRWLLPTPIRQTHLGFGFRGFTGFRGSIITIHDHVGDDDGTISISTGTRMTVYGFCSAAAPPAAAVAAGVPLFLMLLLLVVVVVAAAVLAVAMGGAGSDAVDVAGIAVTAAAAASFVFVCTLLFV